MPPNAHAAGHDIEPTITVVSSRPDQVTGGSALIEVKGTLEPAHLDFELDGKPIFITLHPVDSDARWIGRLEGIDPGTHVLRVRSPGGDVSLALNNHPIDAPIFSGSHQLPFFCETETSGLGPALDANCSAPEKIAYFYKSTHAVTRKGYPMDQMLSLADRGCAALPCNLFHALGFKDFDPRQPRPPDIAQTTTTEGRRVDFIVRRERGTINRGIYEIYFLNSPGEPLSSPWSRAPEWNGRLVYDFGCCGGPGHRQGIPILPIYSPEAILSQGYALATSSLSGPFAFNDIVAAETVSMVKEHFIKTYGLPDYTIGWGGSGGAIRQLLIAQNYPGLIDGVVASQSFPDLVTLISSTAECALLERAFEKSQLAWTDEQKAAASGYSSWRVCLNWLGEATSWLKPSPCDFGPQLPLPKELVYSSSSNPRGMRCDIFDDQVNVWGYDSATHLARRPIDNVGVQYGLVPFRAGAISAEQFLGLNESVGGFDGDGNLTALRSVANPETLKIAYISGRVNSGRGGLASVPIIDVRPYWDARPDGHDSVRSLILRERLIAANGTAANHVILTMPDEDIFDPDTLLSHQMPISLLQIDEWLRRLMKSAHHTAKDTGRLRPRALADACWTTDGEKIVERRTTKSDARCSLLYPTHGDIRIAAGAPLTDDSLKCVLKPVARTDYYPQTLTDDQLQRLKTTFPQGVCDYSRRGTWETYGPAAWSRY